MGWHNSVALRLFGASGFYSSLIVSILLSMASSDVHSQSPVVQRDVCVVVGAEGEPEYGDAFRMWAKRWQDLFEKSNDEKPIGFKLIDGSASEGSEQASEPDHQTQVLKWISHATASDDMQRPQERWLVLIGHGTFDPTQKVSASKFNLRGPDLTTEMIAAALNQEDEASNKGDKVKWIIINCSSCSGPFINALSGPNRIIITATKSGSEQNYARFGEYLSQCISDPRADLDHDKSVSLLEAFLLASDQTASFYESDGRLPSEQSLLDDNGDRRGTPAIFFQGLRPVKSPAENLALDGLRSKQTILQALPGAAPVDATLQAKIELIEEKIEALRGKKKELSEDDYYKQLEQLFRAVISIK
jgi:hypothetical protein